MMPTIFWSAQVGPWGFPKIQADQVDILPDALLAPGNTLHQALHQLDSLQQTLGASLTSAMHLQGV